MKIGFTAVLAVALLVGNPTAAEAAKVVFSGSNASGSVNGSFAYDLASAPYETDTDENRTYASYTPALNLYNFSFTSSITSGLITADDNYTIFINDVFPNSEGNADTFNVFGFKQLFGFETAMFRFDLNLPDASALSSAALPGILPQGSAFFSYDGPFDSLSMPVTFSTVAAVPETATWAMMILGLGMVGSAMRRRRKTVGSPLQRV